MRFKKLMLVTFLSLAILTLGAVSASEDTSAIADVSQDDTLAVVDAQEDLAENPSEEIIASDDGEILADDSTTNSNVTIDVENRVDYSMDTSTIAYVRDENSLNGTVTLSIDGKQFYSNDFNGSDNSMFIRQSNLKDFNFEDYLGNHTVNVAYNGVTKQSVVSFIFEPYFTQPYYGGLGDTSCLVFKALSTSSGSLNLYYGDYNNETETFEQNRLIGTYPIKGSLSIVPIPALTSEGLNIFYANFTVDGKNDGGPFAIYASENSKQVTATLSDTEILPGESVTLKMTTPNA